MTPRALTPLFPSLVTKLEQPPQFPHLLILRIYPSAARWVSGFLIFLGILGLTKSIQDNLTLVNPLALLGSDLIGLLMLLGFTIIDLFFPLLIMGVGLLCLRYWGGSTIARFDKQAKQVSIYRHKLLGGQPENLSFSVTDIAEVYVETKSQVKREKYAGISREVISFEYHLLMRMKEGYSLPLSPGGDFHRKAHQVQQEIATKINYFLKSSY